MSMLNQLTSISQKKAKRIGRGLGSGKGGHTSSRGAKGQLARAGTTIPLWFEGGQLPLVKRLPMWRGKGRLNPMSKVAEVRLAELARVKSDKITLDALKLAKVVPPNATGAKIIGNTPVSQKYVIVAPVRLSAGAQKVITAAGGVAE